MSIFDYLIFLVSLTGRPVEKYGQSWIEISDIS